MSTKLTLSIKKETIEKAKEYAKSRNVSLSLLIENYLQKLIAGFQPDDQKKASIADELSGMIQLDVDWDYKEGYSEHLREKCK